MNKTILQENNLSQYSAVTPKPDIGNYFILPLYFTLLYWLLAPIYNLLNQLSPVIPGKALFASLPVSLHLHVFYGTVLFCAAGVACSTLNRGRPFRFTRALLVPATRLFLIFYLLNLLYLLLHNEFLSSMNNYVNWNVPHPLYVTASHCLLDILKLFIFIILFVTVFRASKRRLNHSIIQRLPIRDARCHRYIHQLHTLLFALCINLWLLLLIKISHQLLLLFNSTPADHILFSTTGVISLFLLINLSSIALSCFFTHSQFPATLYKLSCQKVVLSTVTCIVLQLIVGLILAMVLLIMMPASWRFDSISPIDHIGLAEISFYGLCTIVLYYFLSRFSIRHNFG